MLQKFITSLSDMTGKQFHVENDYTRWTCSQLELWYAII